MLKIEPAVAAQNRMLLHKPDTLYQFDAVSPPKNLKVRQQAKYFWYRDDTILVTQGGYNGRLLNGDFWGFLSE